VSGTLGVGGWRDEALIFGVLKLQEQITHDTIAKRPSGKVSLLPAQA
jgi:hypothetical protein